MLVQSTMSIPKCQLSETQLLKCHPPKSQYAIMSIPKVYNFKMSDDNINNNYIFIIDYYGLKSKTNCEIILVCIDSPVTFYCF